MKAETIENMSAMSRHAKEAAQLLKLLSNESRLMICCALGDQELNVGEINERVPLSQSALSQHLAKLREAGLVHTRKEGLVVFYRLKGTDALQIIKTLKSIYCPEM